MSAAYLVATFFTIGIVFLIIDKVVLFLVCRRLRVKGFNFRNILIVGTGSRAQNFIKHLNYQPGIRLKNCRAC